MSDPPKSTKLALAAMSGIPAGGFPRGGGRSGSRAVRQSNELLVKSLLAHHALTAAYAPSDSAILRYKSAAWRKIRPNRARLHDSIEDVGVARAELTHHFGEDIASLAAEDRRESFPGNAQGAAGRERARAAGKIASVRSIATSPPAHSIERRVE